MAKKADNYFVKVAKYQKEHPRATREHAMKMVSKECKVGAKKKVAGKRVGARKTGPKMVVAGKKPKKRSITKTERIVTVGAKKRKSSASISTAISISNKIDNLTALLKNTSGTDAKNRVKRAINAEHDKLDALNKRLKSA
jgi:hypothetical protein